MITLFDIPRSIIGLDEEALEGLSIIGKLLQVIMCHLRVYLRQDGWIDEGDTNSFEIGSSQ